MRLKRLRFAISAVALGLLIAHLIWPALRVDAITVALFVASLVPWLQPLLHRVQLGTLSVEFQPQSVDEQKAQLARVSDEPTSGADSLPAPTAAQLPAPARPSVGPPSTRLLAEDLVMRLLDQGEFGGTIRRHVTIRNRRDLAFDGVGRRHGVQTLIEVKHTTDPGAPDDSTIGALLAKLRGVDQEYREHDTGGGTPLLLCVVTDMNADRRAALESRLHEKWGNRMQLEIRVYDLLHLRQTFGIS